MSGGTDSLKSTPNDRFFRNFFMAGFYFTLRVIARNLLFRFDAWPGGFEHEPYV